jgi:trehalose 6-phosphate synthase
MKRRLIVVSNRVAVPRDLRPGGLALAMRVALSEVGGIWFGWSGKVTDAETALHSEHERGVTFLTLDLTRQEYAEYYGGFANRTLWPLFHFRPSLVDFKRQDWQSYVAVNVRFADRLAELAQPDDLIWVHDYHLIPLAQLLRERGVRARLGFFLHTPFPPWELLRMLPVHRELFEALAAYDLVGFHTDDYLRAFRDYLLLEVGGEMNESGMLSVFGGRRSLRVGVFPIGIDPARVRSEAERAFEQEPCRQLAQSLGDRALILSVDRLDYSKGLLERLRAYDQFLTNYPDYRRKVSLLQIAPVSRSTVVEYRQLRRKVEHLAGSINGAHAEPDWTPVRYVGRAYPQALVNGFLRMARVGFVTPLRDGMNLVAKEFVAAQDGDDPGALVLSRFAGAARELDGAILVNPHDTEGVAASLAAALRMSLDERRARWTRMMTTLERNSIDAWRRDFLAALQG